MTVRRQHVKVASRNTETRNQLTPVEFTANTKNSSNEQTSGNISTKTTRAEMNTTVTMITVTACFGILMLPSYMIYLFQMIFRVSLRLRMQSTSLDCMLAYITNIIVTTSIPSSSRKLPPWRRDFNATPT
jgi:beta-lactamase regulating signal transducer with metallopeptidase domain